MPKKFNSKSDLTEDSLSISETDELSARIEDAVNQVRENMLSSEELAENPVEHAPTPSSTSDPRVQSIMAEGDDMKMRIARHNVPAPMQPTHGSRELSGFAAMSLAKAKQLEREKLNKTARSSWEGAVSYIECHDQNCLGPGIWIKGDPRGQIESDNWWSSYKAPGGYWPPNITPHCQCCEHRLGIRNKLRGLSHISVGPPGPEQRRVGIATKERYVRTITEAEYQALFAPEPAKA